MFLENDQKVVLFSSSRLIVLHQLSILKCFDVVLLVLILRTVLYLRIVYLR